MRRFLRKIASYDRKLLLRVAAVAAAGSAIVSTDPNYRDSILANGLSLSVPWRLNLSTLGSAESDLGSFPINFSVASQGSQDPQHESGHECHCLRKDTFSNAAGKVSPAVVNIAISKEIPGLFFTGKSMGSGTIIDPNGTILTCAHIFTDYSGKMLTSNMEVEARLQDDRIFEGSLLYADIHSDVAIVKIKSKVPLPYAKLGTSSQLRPGDWVIAVGCPLSLQNTVTAGIVSSVNRTNSDMGLSGTRMVYLQTDCAINKGSSGGPLVNLDGEVIGLNVMGAKDADGLNFSIPIDYVCKVIEHLKKSGKVVRPWLGLKMMDINEMMIALIKSKEPAFPDVKHGVLVPTVVPDSPGGRAGFLHSDVIIEFDQKPIRSVKEVVELLDDKIGVPIKVVVKRRNNVVVDLVVVPEEANPNM